LPEWVSRHAPQSSRRSTRRSPTAPRVVAYDFNLPEIVSRLEKLGSSLKVIIDDSKGHGGPGTAETEAEGRLVASAGRANVLRQHVPSLALADGLRIEECSALADWDRSQFFNTSAQRSPMLIP
jgi:hypothetical protein